MKNTRFIKLVATGTLLLTTSALSLTAFSQQDQGPCAGRAASGPMGMMGGGHMGMMTMFADLGLTEEQREQISAIQHKLHKQHWSIMGQMIDVKEELRTAHSGDRPDPSAVGAVYGKMFDLQRKMIEARMEAKNKALDLLTEEQVAQMKSMKQKRRGMMHGQGGMMQGRGGQTN